MNTQSWSRFPKIYQVSSRLSDGRQAVTLQELEDVIGMVLEGKLGGLDNESNAYKDTLMLLEIIVHRDMPARALDPQTDTGIYKLFESQTRLGRIMSAFREANDSDKITINNKAMIAVEKFYIDYLWLEALLRSEIPPSSDLVDEAVTNASQHFSLAYYLLAQKDRLNRPKNPGPAPENALKTLLVAAPDFQMPVTQEELLERIIKRTENDATRSSLSNDYTRPFRHIPFGAYPAASLKVLADVINDPWIIFNTLSAAHGAWAYHDEIGQKARGVIGRFERAA